VGGQRKDEEGNLIRCYRITTFTSVMLTRMLKGRVGLSLLDMCMTEVPRLWGAPWGCVTDIFVLKEKWAHNRICILVGTSFGSNYFYLLVPILAQNYKQHIFRRLKLAFFACRNTLTNKN
jgi:hypothetical protein